MTFKEIQDQIHFVFSYSEDYRADRRPHKDFEHAVLHIAKANGRLAELCDNLDHGDLKPRSHLQEIYARFLADVIICAMRAANEFPGGVLDLEAAVLSRAREKGMLPAAPKEDL